jgi:hypothetical protein
VSVYLLCITPPYKHARSYVGWTQERTVDHRVNQHLAGGSKANPLILHALLAGHTVELHRKWEGDEFDRTFERKLKSLGGKARARRCPLCGAQRRQATKTKGGAAK